MLNIYIASYDLGKWKVVNYCPLPVPSKLPIQAIHQEYDEDGKTDVLTESKGLLHCSERNRRNKYAAWCPCLH